MLPKFSVKKPFTVFVSVIMVLILGFVSFTKMTPDLLPSIDLPYVIAMTTYAGSSPQKIETAVTKPIEQAVSTTNGIKNISSISNENYSLIILEFNQDTNMDTAMLDLNGKIDMIITKSIPRFARNTLDTLRYVRLLREKNVAIYFEVEKINTLVDGEFLMTILSSVAQQEVENTSAYVKKGLKMKMKRGELVGFSRCFGYDRDKETGELKIVESEAETVRHIFDRYLQGAGGTVIARELNEEGILTYNHCQWTCSIILNIIKNEKYMGDMLQGKTYTVDPISKRRLPNNGEEDKFYVEGHHEPIVSRKVFDKAQELRISRNVKRAKTSTESNRVRIRRQYAFSCMLECGFCGASLSRRRWHSSSKYKKTIWQCVKSTKSGKRCWKQFLRFHYAISKSRILLIFRLLP